MISAGLAMDRMAPFGVLCPGRSSRVGGCKPRFMRQLLRLLLIALPILLAPTLAAAVDLQPHRAVYRMVLASVTRNSDVVSANGVMIYRFARGCDGWTVENRTLLRLLYQDDTETDSLWSFVSWESLDGRHFRYHARYDQDGRNVEKLDGVAELEAGGGVGRARFSDPGKEIALPAETLFPTAHVREMLTAAATGRTSLTRVVFDGASLDNPYLVSAHFGPLASDEAAAIGGAFNLPQQPGWWSRMAFFPSDALEAVPDFEMGAHYRADGIADFIVQQFDGFSLGVRLKEIELLPQPDC
jgi:hypothetical protein